MRDQFAEVLEGLAKAEDDHVEPVLFLMDQDAVRLAAAWRRLKKEWAATSTPPPAEDAARWDWLWAQVSFSVEDWAGLANVALPVVRRLARVMVDNRVVYLAMRDRASHRPVAQFPGSGGSPAGVFARAATQGSSEVRVSRSANTTGRSND